MDIEKGYKILIVDDSDINRDILKTMLSDDFEIIEAADGIEAMDLLRDEKSCIDLCLLDINMPKMNGFEVLGVMTREHILDRVPVIVISGEQGENQIEKAYDMGALDYVTKPFDARIVRRRVISTVMLFEKQKELSDKLQEQINANNSRINELTGLPTYSAFFRICDEIIESGKTSQKKYCMVAIDIEHFRLFNDWFGRKEGDEYLIELSNVLKDVSDEEGEVAGHLGGDNFALFIPYDYNVIDYIQERVLTFLNKYGQSIGFCPMYGIFEVNDETYHSQLMYDNAVTAMADIPGDYLNRIAIYDPNFLRKTGDELMLLSDVQRGMDAHEFTFFLQPKVNMLTGKIIGAEALVRWAHKSKGIVSPGVFVPVLEDNGFITSLDRYIWEEVCIWQRSWIDSGREPIPISVNVSQIDIFSGDVADYFINMIKKYDLEPRLIDIEITESAYAKEINLITKTVDKLRKAGFKVFLDDFGSAYSSLNMLSKLKVDVIKLDMKFLDISREGEEKGLKILDSVVDMANQMGTPIIVEGVEKKEQAVMLTQIGCVYAQGFYYYKPMPVRRFEELIKDISKIEFQTEDIPRCYKPLQVKEFLRTNLFSDSLINTILGPFAFYEMGKEGKIRVIRVNEQYCNATGINYEMVESYDETREYKIDNYSDFSDLFYNAYEAEDKFAEGDVRYKYREEDKTFYMRVFFVNEREDCKIFCATIWDVTKYKQ